MSPKSRIAQALVLATALIGAAAPSFAHGAGSNSGGWNNGGGWSNNGWNNNNGGGWNNNGGGWNQQRLETVNISIDRIVGNETLPLRQMGNIGNQYNGRTLRSVTVELMPWGSAGQVQLVVNGQVVAAAYSAGKQRIELRPQGADTFGSEIQTLQLRTIGWVPIDDIALSIQGGNGGGGGGWQQPVACQTIERPLNTQVSFGQLDLNNLFNLAQFNGCRISSISLVASTAFGQGQVAGLVNGTEATNRQQVGTYPNQYTLTFWNQPTAGFNAPQLSLNLMGQFTIRAVRLNLVSASGW
ncbi:MAG: hypothetical protein R3F55_15150 [Alphaproteobacteria bacterium]